MSSERDVERDVTPLLFSHTAQCLFCLSVNLSVCPVNVSIVTDKQSARDQTDPSKNFPQTITTTTSFCPCQRQNSIVFWANEFSFRCGIILYATPRLVVPVQLGKSHMHGLYLVWRSYIISSHLEGTACRLPIFISSMNMHIVVLVYLPLLRKYRKIPFSG